jgi:hypothetical protein
MRISGEPPAPAQPARLYADTIRYEGGVIVAEGEGSQGVRFESGNARVTAQRIWLDVENRTVRAEGTVVVERSTVIERRPLVDQRIRVRPRAETVIETLRGDNFHYDFNARQGGLDAARLELANFTVSAESLVINGQRYTAHNVLLRPGALTEGERKIYGTPPLNLRASTVIFDAGDEEGQGRRTIVRGGGLYFKNTRLLQVPSYIFRSVASQGPQRDPQTFTLTPRISFNSTDRVLVTTALRFPLTSAPEGLSLNADIGLSARIGARGGLELEAPTRVGTFSLRGRINDIVTTQLTNRIVLDREPELTYESPRIPLFRLPGGYETSLRLGASVGRYSERTIGENSGEVNSSRSQARAALIVRPAEDSGPYLELFARAARYGSFDDRYRDAGFEVGYFATLFNRLRGVASYRSASVSGETPFRFDEVEIERELRTTFDVLLTPRYLIPIDLRYDLDRRAFRDKTFGILRSYKTFAYGVSYQTARHDLRLEFRSGF